MQILIGTSALRTSQVAEVALNITGIVNLVLHLFLRSNADRLAIRAIETPWSDKGTIRVFGPSDLNVREHISYPVLWQEGDYDHNTLVARSEKASQRSPTDSEYDAYSASGPFQHVVFPSPTAKASRLTPPLRVGPVRQVTQNNSSYALFPTSTSTAAHVSSSTTFEIVNDDSELPLPPAPLFAREHDRSTSSQSSATVQIGLRLSYMNHALDPIEASPPSIIGLPAPFQAAGLPDHDDSSRPALMRASASSESITDFGFLPTQTYKAGATTPHEIFVEPKAIMPDPAEHVPRPIVPRRREIRAEPLILPQQAFDGSRQAPVPRPVPEPALAVIHPSSPVPAPLQQGPSPRHFKKPQPIFPMPPTSRAQPPFPTHRANRPQVTVYTQFPAKPQAVAKPKPASPVRPSGLSRGPKPAPSWRPQNWDVPKDSSSISPKTQENEGKALPCQKSLPTVPPAAQMGQTSLKSKDPFNTGTPQVIHRPPGWK